MRCQSRRKFETNCFAMNYSKRYWVLSYEEEFNAFGRTKGRRTEMLSQMRRITPRADGNQL